jgi:hypothetical protein
LSTTESSGPRHDVVSLGDEDAVKEVVWKSVLGLWDLISDLTRLRPSRSERYRVSIFGSARAGKGSFAYEETTRVAGVLAELGCDIVTGGGPGLMEAANEGAASSPERVRSGPGHFGVAERGIIALINPERLRRILPKMLDEAEFLSPYGIRSISRFHERHPCVFNVHGQEYRVDYLPASRTAACSAAIPTGGGRSGCRSTSCSSGRS